MKKLLTVCGLLASLLLSGSAGSAFAYTISLSPLQQTIGVGGSAAVNVDLMVGSGETLFGYDLVLAYDPLILALNSAATTTAGDFSGLTDLIGSVALDGIFTSAPPTNQTVTLATLSFLGKTGGSSPLSLTGSLLDLYAENTISFDPVSATVNVAAAAPVPEPSTVLLLAVVLGGVGLSKLRRHRA